MKAVLPVPHVHVRVEPAIGATRSEEFDSRPVSLAQLLREGLLAAALTFVWTGSQSVILGGSHAARLQVIVQGFVILLGGMFAAKTLAGRVFLALAYMTFFEHNYFSPIRLAVFTLSPSTFLLLFALVWETLRPRWRVLLTVGAVELRLPILVLAAMLYAALLVTPVMAAADTMQGLTDALRRYTPVFLFAIAGAMILRRGEGALFLDLVPFLAVCAAITAWVYHLTGERVLYYEDPFAYREILGRFGGLLRNANNTAFLCAASAVILIIRLHRTPAYMKLVSLGSALYLAATIVLLRSRGPLLLLVLVLLCLMRNRYARRTALAFVMLSVVGFFVAGSRLTASQSEEVARTSMADRIAELPAAFQVRLQAMRDALSMAGRRPFGIGPVGGILSTDIESVTRLEAHNEYIGFLVSNGFHSVALLALLAALIGAAWWRAARSGLPHRPGTALAALLAAFLITFNFEPIHANSHELSALFGVVVGMVVASALFAGPQAMVGWAPLRPDFGATALFAAQNSSRPVPADWHRP